jgi:hypothetical protein
LNEVKQRMSAAFESKSLRDPFGDEIKLNCAPGPGRYQVPEQTIKLSEARKPALQCFESTTERFANVSMILILALSQHKLNLNF